MMFRNRKRRGVSIAEMCIVLAVLAITGTVVVTFTAMVGARSSASVARLNAAEDIEVSQIMMENWADRMAQQQAVVGVDDTGLYATVADQTYRVEQGEGALFAQIPDGQPLSCPVNKIEEFRFQVMTRADGNPLIFCTVVYTVKNPAGEDRVFEDTFTVCSRVGEVIAG